MAKDNPLYKPNLEALGRAHGYDGKKISDKYWADPNYRKGLQDGRTRKQDEFLRSLPPAKRADARRAFGNASNSGSFKTRGPLTGGGCAVLLFLPAALLVTAVWQVIS